MAGLLDLLAPSSDGGGLLDFLKKNLSTSSDPSGLALAPDMTPANFDPQQGPGVVPSAAPAVPQNPPPVVTAQAAAATAPQQAAPVAQPNAPAFALQAPAVPPSSGPVTGFLNRTADALQSISRGGSLTGAIRGQYDDPLSMQGRSANVTLRALNAAGVNSALTQAALAQAAIGNNGPLGELLKQTFSGPQFENIGEGHLLNKRNGKVTQAYEPEDKTPQSVLEYQYYRQNFKPTAAQPQPLDYATFSTAKARAGATNIVNSFDPNGAQTYDKQLVDGLAKSHASLSNGVEEAQTRARDIAALQGAIDQIQKNGGTTGGFGQEKILDLKKTINSGARALGIESPFNEGDISDKEFLTKFNRSLAGAQAKNSVGNRVTNFELSNYLKSNPGLELSVTGNQRLLGIQAQIEQRNIAVGNAIRQATAEAVSTGKTINPVQVQKIITDYDEQHHVKDPITGQDLTQSYALPEFQKGGTNADLAKTHDSNVGKIRRYNPATGALE